MQMIRKLPPHKLTEGKIQGSDGVSEVGSVPTGTCG